MAKDTDSEPSTEWPCEAGRANEEQQNPLHQQEIKNVRDKEGLEPHE
jgi:hypothetical protein